LVKPSSASTGTSKASDARAAALRRYQGFGDSHARNPIQPWIHTMSSSAI
jgi:hypothetical protein